MRTLRFHRALYSDAAIQEAVETYSPHGRLELTEEEPYAVVRVEPAREGLGEGELAGELANHALTRSIEQRRSQ